MGEERVNEDIVIGQGAIVSPLAIIGKGVEIGAYSIVHAGAEIGDDTSLQSHVVVHSGARIGKGNRIFTGAVIASPPQDLKYKDQPTIARIGDNNIIREFVTVNTSTDLSDETTIGNNCLLMAYAHIAHNCHLGSNVILANAVNLGGHIEIEDWAIIGGMVPIHQFTRIGCHIMVGGGFRVVQDLVPYMLYGRVPCEPIGVNTIGLRRRGFSSESILHLREAFKVLFLRFDNIKDACKDLEDRLGDIEEIRHIIEFIRLSKRGLTTKRKTGREEED